MKALLAIVCLLVPFAAVAETFSGRVVSVADGDTITVLVDHMQVKVRLIEIDAPEKKQAFGNRSKQSLAALVYGKDGKFGGGARQRSLQTHPGPCGG